MRSRTALAQRNAATESERSGSGAGRRSLNWAILATPVVAGFVWFGVFAYADMLKERNHAFMSDGWTLAPWGTAFVVICAVVLALQVILLIGALPDTYAGRWIEAALAVWFGLTVGLVMFGVLGLFTLGDEPDGFPDDAVCAVGLAVGVLVTLAIPTVAIVWRATRYPPAGTALPTSGKSRLAMRAAATVLLTALPVIAETTATPAVLWGLWLVLVIDVASSWRRVAT